MEASRKRVCVLMSTYNGQKYIKSQIDSIEAQKDVDVILIVRDDGSSDATVSIIQELAGVYSNIQLYIEENVGPCRSFVKTVEYGASVEADYYAFADQDDVWLPDKLIAAVRKLDMAQGDRPSLYFSNLTVVDEALDNKRSMYSESFDILPKQALIRSYGYGCTMVFNRQLLEAVLYSAKASMWMHDYWLYLIAIYTGSIIYDDNSYILYRQHGDNAVGANKKGFIKRIAMFFKVKGTYPREAMARDLLKYFGSYMTTEKTTIIEDFLNYKTSLASRIRAMGDSDYLVFDARTNLYLKIRILLGIL